jgi:hypothetical protein
LTEALADGYDPRNGTSVMERIRNQRYRSVFGFDVSQIFLYVKHQHFLYTVCFFSPRKVFIDSNGDAEGNYTVLSMLPFRENHFKSDEGTRHTYVMQPVGHFQHNISSARHSPNDSLVSFSRVFSFLSWRLCSYFDSGFLFLNGFIPLLFCIGFSLFELESTSRLDRIRSTRSRISLRFHV